MHYYVSESLARHYKNAQNYYQILEDLSCSLFLIEFDCSADMLVSPISKYAPKDRDKGERVSYLANELEQHLKQHFLKDS